MHICAIIEQNMFEEFKAILESMTPEQREKKLTALNRVTQLRSLCKAKGWADLEVEKMRIVITDQTKEVDDLLQALEDGGVGGIKKYVLVA